MFEDCMSLLDEGFANYKMYDVTQSVYFNREVSVVDGKKNIAIIAPKEKYYYPLQDFEIKNLNYKVEIPDKLVAPKKTNEEVGEIKIFFNNNLIFSLKFTTIEDVETKGVIERFFDILNRW